MLHLNVTMYFTPQTHKSSKHVHISEPTYFSQNELALKLEIILKMEILPIFSLLIFPTLLFLPESFEQGNGNILALRTSPEDDVYPIPYMDPPPFIRTRINTFISWFFDEPQDQSEAESILVTIWQYNTVYNMLELVDRMERKQYTYSEFGDECVGPVNDSDTVAAFQFQKDTEGEMVRPGFIQGHNHFFKLDAWWDIIGNTIDSLWNRNQLIAEKLCDYRRKGLICLNNTSDGIPRCGCPKDGNGNQMTALKGGICAIEVGQACNFTSANRLMSYVHAVELYNNIPEENLVTQTCVGDGACSKDFKGNGSFKCQCLNLIISEIRAKRNVLLNVTVGGKLCDRIIETKIIKWGKWYVVLSIVFLSIPLILILVPHYDDFFFRFIPAYYNYLKVGKERAGEFQASLKPETYDVKMDPELKAFINEHAVIVDTNDDYYYDKVDAVDERELDPMEKFILVPLCTNRNYHFDWPTIDKLKVWF